MPDPADSTGNESRRQYRPRSTIVERHNYRDQIDELVAAGWGRRPDFRDVRHVG